MILGLYSVYPDALEKCEAVLKQHGFSPFKGKYDARKKYFLSGIATMDDIKKVKSLEGKIFKLISTKGFKESKIYNEIRSFSDWDAIVNCTEATEESLTRILGEKF